MMVLVDHSYTEWYTESINTRRPLYTSGIDAFFVCRFLLLPLAFDFVSSQLSDPCLLIMLFSIAVPLFTSDM
jgi:hypothetical protein